VAFSESEMAGSVRTWGNGPVTSLLTWKDWTGGGGGGGAL